jgi:hypothetical protein
MRLPDTTESLQVAQIIKSSYYNIVDGKDYPFLYELFQLDASGSTDRPTHMRLPDTIIDLDWIRYNKRKLGDTKNRYERVHYKDPESFLELVNPRDSSSSTVQVVLDSTDIELNIRNDKAPEYFTSFDDDFIVFDSFDSEVDTTLQNSKTQARGKRSVAFTLSDNFVPDLPVQMFTYLLNESKSACFARLKQVADVKSEQHSISQKRRMSQDAWKVSKGIKFPNYGRK